MANALIEFWWLLKYGLGWREVRRTKAHARLGELHYVGRRTRPGGHVTGTWKVLPAGFERAFGVDFPTEGNEPTAEGLAQLEEMLADLDGLFERARPQIREAYEQMVEESMPSEWRDAFELDHLELPDPTEPEPEWQVVYWCEAALHWFVIDFRAELVTDVQISG